ncbi:hypothetical protein CB0940_12228 [Cercospora beticola]|uniref:Chromo domain-containing protein n=1 Tax=Cercospora beticola TaxID=122368 RepID=A0A2G5GKR1_CERBT|nr:hypothetical protein CB0940_12228 [Cercospora beticola]PIA80869.1 hypothetical protein CB0940_12228 [Cercospora beticola]WPB08531.1 hypothetical protein RHO25_013197 [Cercospora beticola]
MARRYDSASGGASSPIFSPATTRKRTLTYARRAKSHLVSKTSRARSTASLDPVLPPQQDDTREFDVEAIIDENRSTRRFLVRWSGTNPATGSKWPDSWEPRSNLNRAALEHWRRTARPASHRKASGRVRSTADRGTAVAATEEEEDDDDGDTENVWAVEAILDERARHYLIRWDGADPATGQKWSDSWEPKANVGRAAIEEWEASQNGKTTRKKKKKK